VERDREVKCRLDKIAAPPHARAVAASALASALTFFLMVVLKEGCGTPRFWSPDSWFRGWLGGVYCTVFCFLVFRTEKK